MTSSFQVLWARTAECDLAEIIDHIANDSPANARAVLRKLKGQAGQLDHYPERGRIVPELRHQGIVQYRELILPPWRIIYRVDDNNVYVLCVLDGRQNVEDLLLKRLLRQDDTR